MYSKIINPETNRYVSINSKLGQNIIKNYISIIGGDPEKMLDTEYWCDDCRRRTVWRHDVEGMCWRCTYRPICRNIEYEPHNEQGFTSGDTVYDFCNVCNDRTIWMFKFEPRTDRTHTYTCINRRTTCSNWAWVNEG